MHSDLFVVTVLLALTNNHQADMVAVADMLGERVHNTNWVVVFKALITSHTLITLGNEVSILIVYKNILIML